MPRRESDNVGTTTTPTTNGLFARYLYLAKPRRTEENDFQKERRESYTIQYQDAGIVRNPHAMNVFSQKVLKSPKDPLLTLML